MTTVTLVLTDRVGNEVLRQSEQSNVLQANVLEYNGRYYSHVTMRAIAEGYEFVYGECHPPILITKDRSQ